MAWLLLISATLCVASIVVLTMLIPGRDSYPADGGFLPIPAPSAAR